MLLPALLPLFFLTHSHTTVAPRPRTAEMIARIDLKDADLVDVLRYFSTLSRLNLILDPAVHGRVSLRLVDVPWDTAFETLLKTNGLWYRLEGNVVWVAPTSTLLQRAQEVARLEEERRLSAPLATLIVELSYAEAETVASLLRTTVLTRRGSVSVDARTNRLIVTDVAPALPRAATVARSLDRP